jgi:uncharacterized membrane-anchored protein
MSRFAFVLVMAGVLLAPWAHAQQSDPSADAQQAAEQKQAEEYRAKLRALRWVTGPSSIPIPGNSTLKLPDNYVSLDAANTSKYEELTHNLSGGNEVLVAPKSLAWVAYLEFSDDGLVKDNEKIDSDAILSSLKSATAQANEERRRRGWNTLQITGWAIPPAYSTTTKRLEWATLYESEGEQGVNFFTKILGRRGVTSVVLVSLPQDLNASVGQLNQVLTGYDFNSGERYADWKPGDKVAEYGLAGLILGGGVAAAAKTGLLKGLWKVIVGGLVAAWKLIAAAVVAIGAWLRSIFSRKKAGTV